MRVSGLALEKVMRQLPGNDEQHPCPSGVSSNAPAPAVKHQHPCRAYLVVIIVHFGFPTVKQAGCRAPPGKFLGAARPAKEPFSRRPAGLEKLEREILIQSPPRF